MWAQLSSAVVGVWLMAAPFVLGYGGGAAVSDRIVGPCVAALAGVAVGACTRSVRFWLLPFATWLIVAPFVLEGVPVVAAVNGIGSGVLLVALSFVRGRVAYRFNGGWAALFRKDAPESEEAT